MTVLIAGTQANVGKYDALYRAAPGFLWGDQPGSLVRKFLGDARGASIVDLGCGDGKNAVWLAQRGNNVLALDVSEVALAMAARRSKAHAGRNLFFVRGDVTNLGIRQDFDVAIAYGLFQCLDDGGLQAILSWLVSSVRPGGMLVGAALTAGLRIPDTHGTGELFLRPAGWYRDRLQGLWKVVHYEVGEIEEVHLPLAKTHKHELARFLLIRQNDELYHGRRL